MVELRILVLVGLIVTTIVAIGTVLAVSLVVGWVRRLGSQTRARGRITASANSSSERHT